MATVDLMDQFSHLGEGGIRNNGTLDDEVRFQSSLHTMRTDFIQVKAGDSIVYKNMSGMSSIWNILSFYTGDAQGFYVSGIAGQTTPQSGVWTAAQDGYVRLFGSFPAGDKISVTMTDLAPDVEDYLAKYNAMNYRFLPNSIPKIVAHIQEYLVDHPIADSTTLQAVIDAAFQSYMEEIQQTADTYIAEAVPPAAAAAVDAAAAPALEEISAKTAEAAESAREAALSQQSAEMSEENALTYRNQAQQIKDSISAEVAASVLAAQEQATLAQESAQAADESADTAEQFVAQARAQAEAAADQAQTASGYASDAQGYMQDASGFAQNASDFADNAAQSAATFSTDPTLTISGKAADAKATGDQLSALKSATVDNESVLFELYQKEYTITKTNTAFTLAGKTVGDTADLTPVSMANFGYIVIPCNAGETFILTANGGSGNHPWACLDENNIILSMASGATVSKGTIITPVNTVKIAIRANCNSSILIIRGSGIVNTLNGEDKILTFPVIAGYWTPNGSEGTGTSYRRTENSIFFRAGTTFKITALAVGSATSGALMTEWTEDGVFIQTLVGFANNTTETVYKLDHDAYIRFSYRNSEGFKGTFSTPNPAEVMSAVSELNKTIESEPYEWERILNSICCIGDSLTRGAYFVNGHDGSAIEQNYPYFFSKQSGVPVRNEGVSGSNPSSRWSYFSTFDFTPYNAFFIWWGTNGGLTDTLEADGVIDSEGNLITDYSTYANTNTGCYCKTIGRIIEQVPHAKIFLASIYTTSADTNVTNAVINKIADLYPNNVMGVVNCNDGTLYTLASKRLTPWWVHIDNVTHFSMIGNYYLAVHWIKAVRQIIADNPARFENLMEDILSNQ